MLDIERIRKEPEWFDEGLKKRGLQPMASLVQQEDEKRRDLLTRIQNAQSKRNDVSKQIGEIKKSGGNADEMMAQVAALKDQIAKDEAEEQEIAARLNHLLVTTPNIPADDVPFGKDENDNKEVFKFMEPTKFQFNDIKDHVALGELNGLIDFEAAARMSGSRFVVTKGAMARLERSLAMFALDMLTSEFGYTEIMAPLLVNETAAFGAGMLPKFEEDMFKTNTGHYLISTSELSMTNLVMDQIIDLKDGPIRYASYSPCFRSEAGSAGKDTRGMIRQHQFYKVEQVVVCTPEQSQAEHERMANIAETALQRLKLPYRKVLLCSGDMGFASQKTYDIETWIPSQNVYRETMSCSNCGDFQARRMKTRYKPEGSTKTAFVHTLNATCFATGRALVAIIENYQQQDGSIKVPEALLPYMGGIEVIK